MGLISAIAATVFGLLYIIALLLTLLNLIPKPWDTFWQLLPSIFLAWSFVSLMGCLYKSTAPNRNIYAFVGVAVSIIYATINSIVYSTVLTVVIPGLLAGKQSELALLLFEPGKFLFSINGLAYMLMSISALLSSFSFERNGKTAKVKWTMLAHGIIGPFIMGAVLWAPLTYIGALWIATFPAFGIASIIYFNQLDHRSLVS